MNRLCVKKFNVAIIWLPVRIPQTVRVTLRHRLLGALLDVVHEVVQRLDVGDHLTLQVLNVPAQEEGEERGQTRKQRGTNKETKGDKNRGNTGEDGVGWVDWKWEGRKEYQNRQVDRQARAFGEKTEGLEEGEGEGNTHVSACDRTCGSSGRPT
jgi:hypothetical protein